MQQCRLHLPNSPFPKHNGGVRVSGACCACTHATSYDVAPRLNRNDVYGVVFLVGTAPFDGRWLAEGLVLHVKIADVEGVIFDKLAPRLHILAHQC